MPFMTPEHILGDKDNKLNQKEKAQLQIFAKQIHLIWDKIGNYLGQRIDTQEKNNKAADSTRKIWPLTKLESQVNQTNWESYKKTTLEHIQKQFNLTEIAKDPSQRTPEKVAMLQLFLFLKGAYWAAHGDEALAAKNIDGKRGKKTEDACYKAEILKRSDEEQKFIDEVKKNNLYSTGFAQAELGGEFSLRRHQRGWPLDYTDIKPEDIKGTFGIYGWVIWGEKSSGHLYGLFKQNILGKNLDKWTDEDKKPYSKDFASFQRFVHRILTDYKFATEVAIAYEKELLNFCDWDIGAAAAFNLAGYPGLKAYKRRDYDFRIGKNATIWAYVKKVVAYSDPDAPKPKQADILNYKPAVKGSSHLQKSEQNEA